MLVLCRHLTGPSALPTSLTWSRGEGSRTKGKNPLGKQNEKQFLQCKLCDCTNKLDLPGSTVMGSGSPDVPIRGRTNKACFRSSAVKSEISEKLRPIKPMVSAELSRVLPPSPPTPNDSRGRVEILHPREREETLVPTASIWTVEMSLQVRLLGAIGVKL